MLSYKRSLDDRETEGMVRDPSDTTHHEEHTLLRDGCSNVEDVFAESSG